MGEEDFRKWLMDEIRHAKADRHLTYKQMEALTIENGKPIAEATIKAIFRDDGIGHKIATLMSIASALGIDFSANLPDTSVQKELDTANKIIAEKDEQIKSMRKLVHTYRLWLTVAVVVLVVVLLSLVVALAADVIDPALGWIR